jgi:hypothetical protein
MFIYKPTLDPATIAKAKQPLDVVTVKLSVGHGHMNTSTPNVKACGLFHGDHQLEFQGVTSSIPNTNATDIMFARTLFLHDWAVQALKSNKADLDAWETWRANGIIRKGGLGDLNFPNRPAIFPVTQAMGLGQGDPNHHPIVLDADNQEKLTWQINGYENDFMVVVTGDPTMHDHALGNIQAPVFHNIFAPNVFTGKNGGGALGPVQYLGENNYVFFKYNVTLLDTPFATHDPDVICGTPIGK